MDIRARTEYGISYRYNYVRPLSKRHIALTIWLYSIIITRLKSMPSVISIIWGKTELKNDLLYESLKKHQISIYVYTNETNEGIVLKCETPYSKVQLFYTIMGVPLIQHVIFPHRVIRSKLRKKNTFHDWRNLYTNNFYFNLRGDLFITFIQLGRRNAMQKKTISRFVIFLLRVQYIKVIASQFEYTITNDLPTSNFGYSNTFVISVSRTSSCILIYPVEKKQAIKTPSLFLVKILLRFFEFENHAVILFVFSRCK